MVDVYAPQERSERGTLLTGVDDHDLRATRACSGRDGRSQKAVSGRSAA